MRHQLIRHGRRLAALVLCLLLGLAAAGPLGANPFTGERDQEAAEATGQVERVSGPVAAVGRALLTFQREANRLIGSHMRAIRDGETPLALLVGIGLAFAYGVIHALGPGHGKLVVVSYFLARDAQIGRGLLMGLQIAMMHVLSAMVVVALADLLLRQAFGGPPAEVAGIRQASYGLIALIGGVMLVQAVRRSRLRRQGIEPADACCGHGGMPAHQHDHAPREKAEQGALALGVGLVPCTGAVLIMLYAMANGILLTGVILVSAIAAGMAITMGLLGLLSVVARQAVASRIATAGAGRGRLTVISDYAGALAITAIGAGLFWAAL